VTNRNDRLSLLAVLGSIGWPLVVGLAVCSVFYAIVFRGPLDIPVVHRYFSTHPLLFVVTGMFFVGLAALLMKLADVVGQVMTSGSIRMETEVGGNDRDVAGRMLSHLDKRSDRVRHSYLGRRLQDAAKFVLRRGSAEGLDDELKYLAESDAVRQHDSYSLVRIIIWATPMLGFLGTVVGITQALGDLNPEQLATDPKSAMDSLLGGLYVAFDTTALALSLSIVLMFIQFLADRIETQLLVSVDAQMNDEIAAEFRNISAAASDPHLAAVERMSRTVIQTTEELLQRQTELWQTTIDSAHNQWSTLVGTAGNTLQESLSLSLQESMKEHAAALVQAEQGASERVQRRWEQWQTALSDNARTMRSQQEEMSRQADVMLKVVEATGEVVKLEKALNDNLHALAGSKNFEDTVMSLSAAIHLLNMRLGNLPDSQRVVLDSSDEQGRAA